MLHDTASPTVHTTVLKGLKKIHTGKVRDIYEVDAESMLIVTTDRLSAFDVVLPDPIPDKGRVLNSISNFWFARTTHIVPNHLTGRSVDEVVSDPAERALLQRSSPLQGSRAGMVSAASLPPGRCRQATSRGERIAA